MRIVSGVIAIELEISSASHGVSVTQRSSVVEPSPVRMIWRALSMLGTSKTCGWYVTRMVGLDIGRFALSGDGGGSDELGQGGLVGAGNVAEVLAHRPDRHLEVQRQDAEVGPHQPACLLRQRLALPVVDRPHRFLELGIHRRI